VAQGGRLLAEFAGNGNTDGVRRLLDLGVDVAAPFAEGDGYWDVAPGRRPCTWRPGARATRPCAR
jgi:hypothetical protein